MIDHFKKIVFIQFVICSPKLKKRRTSTTNLCESESKAFLMSSDTKAAFLFSFLHLAILSNMLTTTSWHCLFIEYAFWPIGVSLSITFLILVVARHDIIL